MPDPQPAPPAHPHTPRTADEIAILLRDRPDAWEYLLYAGTLFLRMQREEPEYRDHLMRYATLAGDPLDEVAASSRLIAAFPDATALADILMELFESDVQELAFGRPGEPGDPDLIVALAERTMDGYVGMMRWGRDLRGARVPTRFRRAFKLAADMIRTPVEEMRGYVNEMVEKLDATLTALAVSGPTTPVPVIEVALILTVKDSATDAFSAELERLSLDDGH
jgi:hypothetical protein